MIEPRLKRGVGPKSKMTKANYRKKALPHLLKDFEKHCAYCLDPSELRHPSQNHVEHFHCKLKSENVINKQIYVILLHMQYVQA